MADLCTVGTNSVDSCIGSGLLYRKVSVIVKFAHQQDDSTTGFALHHILPLLTPGKRHSKHT